MEKKYSKLTADQFRQLIDHLPKFLEQGTELRKYIATVSGKRLTEVLGAEFGWSSIYELPINKHIALLVLSADEGPMLSDAANATDPQQYILDEISRELGDDVSSKAGTPSATAVAALIALERSFLSITTYQRSLSSLVQEVREQGSDKALFMAVRLDRAAVNCPSIAARIARAELANDLEFFKGLRNALKGPSKKYWQGDFIKLRYALVLLREMGVDSMTDAEMGVLFQETLGLFKHEHAAVKNIRAHYQASRKIPTI